MTTGAYIVVYLRKSWSQDASKLHAIYLITEIRWRSTCSKLPGCILTDSRDSSANAARIPSLEQLLDKVQNQVEGPGGKYPQNFRAS